jgi:hypothetical protein
MITLAPSLTRRRAMALPISPAPPVTITTLSRTEMAIYAPSPPELEPIALKS